MFPSLECPVTRKTQSLLPTDSGPDSEGARMRILNHLARFAG